MYAGRHTYRSPRQWSPYQVPTWPVEIDTSSELAGAGVVAYWLLNQGSAIDQTRKFGSAVAGPDGIPSLTNSSLGPALSWSGSSGSIGWTVNNARILSGRANWTIAVTFQTSSAVSSGVGAPIYCERGPTGGNIVKIDVTNSGFLGFVMRDDASNLFFQDDATSVTNGAISSCAVTYDSSNIRFYNRGALTSTQAWTGTNNFTETGVISTIGYDTNDNTAPCFLGSILQVTLFSTTLTQSQVALINAAPFSMLRPAGRRLPAVYVGSGAAGTSGTPRSVSYLLGTAFPDGKGAGTIKEVDIRDLAASASISADTALTDGPIIATDAALGSAFNVTLGGNRTLANPVNLTAGRSYIWRIIQDGTGSRTLTYGSAFKWPAATPPTLTTTAGAIDVITAFTDGTNLYGTFSANVH